jgi:hypothetical protein
MHGVVAQLKDRVIRARIKRWGIQIAAGFNRNPGARHLCPGDEKPQQRAWQARRCEPGADPAACSRHQQFLSGPCWSRCARRGRPPVSAHPPCRWQLPGQAKRRSDFHGEFTNKSTSVLSIGASAQTLSICSFRLAVTSQDQSGMLEAGPKGNIRHSAAMSGVGQSPELAVSFDHFVSHQ